MSQDYTVNSFQSSHVAQVDMANVEKNLECLRSFFSGTSAPSNAVAGHGWFDTINKLPRFRNAANSAWLAILTGSSSQKIWIYRNDSDDGWTIDATVTDRVLAVKGGSGLYNVNGGAAGGESWANLQGHTHTMSHTHNHNHKWYNNVTDTTLDDETYDSDGDALDLDTSQKGDAKTNANRGYILRSIGTGADPIGDSWTDDDASAASTSTTGAQSTSDMRPAAAVGTLQYPDI